MSFIPIRKYFERASSPLDLARMLGEVCLDRGSSLTDLHDDPDVWLVAERLEEAIEAIDDTVWTAGPNLVSVLEIDEVSDLLALARAHNPIEYLAVLRGLCRRALPRAFNAIEGRFVLERGFPVPFATRPIQERFRATPSQATVAYGHLLEGLEARFFWYPTNGSIRVELDFTHHQRLDQLTWGGKQRLPRVATIHPYLGGQEIEVGEINESWFFDVRPKSWNADSVLAQLRRVATEEIEIAVLPELSLPIADALEAALSSAPMDFPPIVVAGSAHLREPHPSRTREIRANESRIYLDGERVGAHRKIHPFTTKTLHGRKLEHPLPEGLTRETKTITVFSGRRTRLAVVICADLTDEFVPFLLETAGVNLLLVPAMTPEAGGFDGAICGLASRCQAMSVIVNAEFDEAAGNGKLPFHVMAGAPRPEPEEQSRNYRRADEDGEIGVIDPNLPLPQAISWISA